MERDRWKSLLNQLMGHGFACRRVECRLGGFPDVVCTNVSRTLMIELKQTDLYGPYTKTQIRAMMSSPEQYVFNKTWPGELYIMIWSSRQKTWWIVGDRIQKITFSPNPADLLIIPSLIEWQEIMPGRQEPEDDGPEHPEFH